MTERDAAGKFIKGNSGNPTGRAPKEREERYFEILKTRVTFSDWEKIIDKAVSLAIKGDAVSRKWLSDYLVGPPIEKKEISGKDGNDIFVTLKRDD